MQFRSLRRDAILSCTAITAILVCAAAALAQSTGFTYQGRLTDGGTAANGNYDLQFALWDSLSGGNQVGATQTLNTVAVSNGVFTVSLDFGANAFPGASRFLEISTRPSGVGSFTLLTPRQPITSTPYAVRSLNAASADSVPASGVPAGSSNYIRNSTSFQSNSNFNISGNGAADVFSARQFNFFNVSLLKVTGSSFNDSLFLGVGAGESQTVVGGNAFIGQRAGNLNTSGVGNTFVGNGAGRTNTTGTFNTFVGSGADIISGGSTAGSRNTLLGAGATLGSGGQFNPDNATAIGANARVDASNALVLGSIKNLNGTVADTNVGIGTTAPLARLHVVGTTGLMGDVGIGTTAPTAKLSVVAIGDGARVLHLGTERAWVFKQFGTGASTALELTGGDANNNNKNFVINTAGNVGIGTQGPLDKLHVIGDIRVGVFGTNGCLKNNNGGTLIGTCSSDVRFKRDISPFPSLLNKVTQLRPVHYFWRASEFPGKGFGNAQSYGLVAQEVEKVLPELVSEDAQGYKQVDYSKLPLLLLQAIKEQQTQIQKQSELIERQQAFAVRQQQQLKALKKLACRSHRRARACR